MKLRSKSLIPLIFVLVAILYLSFGFSLEQRRMIGDERGWDPGSRAMPIGTGFLMLGVSIYLFLKESAALDGEERTADIASVKLVSLTIALSALYILSFRYIGFVLATYFLLVTLVYFNDSGDIAWKLIPRFMTGAGFGCGFILLLYSLGRTITRYLVLTGKRSKLELLSNRLFTTGITFIVLAVLFLISLGVAKKYLKSKESNRMMKAVCVATATTELLYLVFKQIFWVSLAKGIINW